MATIQSFLADLRKQVDGCPAAEVLLRVSRYSRECGRLEKIRLYGGGEARTVNDKCIEISLGSSEASCCWVSLGGHAIKFRVTPSEI